MARKKVMEDQAAPLTEEQLEAVRAYAVEHGRTWKDCLGTQWMRASAPPVLHALRNTHGPSWLNSFRLEKA